MFGKSPGIALHLTAQHHAWHADSPLAPGCAACWQPCQHRRPSLAQATRCLSWCPAETAPPASMQTESLQVTTSGGMSRVQVLHQRAANAKPHCKLRRRWGHRDKPPQCAQSASRGGQRPGCCPPGSAADPCARGRACTGSTPAPRQSRASLAPEYRCFPHVIPSSVMQIRMLPALPDPARCRPKLSGAEALHSSTVRRQGAVTMLSSAPDLTAEACLLQGALRGSAGQPDEALLVLAAQHRPGVLPPHRRQLAPRRLVNLTQLHQPSIQRLSCLPLPELCLACCQLVCLNVLQCTTSAS